MIKSMGFGAALVLLGGCASWVHDRPVSATASPSVVTAPAYGLDAELRARVEQLRRQPDLASDELVRELEAFLRERERARARPQQAPGSSAPAQPAAEVAGARPQVVTPAAPVVAARPAPAVAKATAAQPTAPGSLAEAEALFARARTLEGERQAARALPLYADASRQGLVAASVRLMELYSSGTDGVTRNYLAAVRYKDLALQQGAKLDYYVKR